MSTTLTYTRSLRNPSHLINFMQNHVRTNTLNYFSYNPSTSTLELIFRNVVDATTKQVVDALVLNYNETQALNQTLAELGSFRFTQLIMANDSTVGTTDTDVFFSSEAYVDRLYFTSSPSRSYIFIQKPGTYLILARVSAFLPDTVTTGNANVAFDLHYDDTRTEQGYLTYPNTTVYITLTPQMRNESTLLSCVFNCNPAAGTYVRVVSRIVSGTASAVLRGGYNSINVMHIANAAYMESVITSASVANLTNNFSNLFLGSDRIVHFPFTRTQGQASTTAQASGWMLLIARGTFTKTSGTDITLGALRFFSVGQVIPFPGTMSHSNNIITGMKTTSNFIGIIPVNAGTSVAMQAQMVQGSNLQLSANESGYIGVFLNATLYTQLSLLNAFTDVTQTTGPVLANNTLNDLTFTTLRTLQPPSPNNSILFSTSTPEIIINDTGVYILTAHISVTNNSTNLGSLNIRLAQSVNGGVTYFPIIGSNSFKTLTGNGRTSVATVAIIPVSSGHRIKVQASASSAPSDNVLFAESCTLSLMKFVTSTLSTGSTWFGTNFHVVVSKELMSIVSTAFVEKCRLVTQFIPAGVYRISSRASFTVPDGASVNYQLVSSSPNGTNMVIANRVLPVSSLSFSTVDYLYLNEGVNTILMQVSSLSDTIASDISNGSIEIWRI